MTLIKVKKYDGLLIDPAGNVIQDREGRLQVDDIRGTEPVITGGKIWKFKGFDCSAWKTSYPGETIPPLYCALATRGKFRLNGKGDTEQEAKLELERWIELTWKSYYKGK